MDNGGTNLRGYVWNPLVYFTYLPREVRTPGGRETVYPPPEYFSSFQFFSSYPIGWKTLHTDHKFKIL